jgi:hypothetical protein
MGVFWAQGVMGFVGVSLRLLRLLGLVELERSVFLMYSRWVSAYS